MIEIREEAFKYYFHFMQKRMDIFWKRYEGSPYPWTDDPILKEHKFTNVYRSSDRVSQYLISNSSFASSPMPSFSLRINL
ncbi:nucleotide kinase domain-containing protein [Bacteroides cellulosilyticus]|uniref:nucleotide kinase domain-containing protein n=1 Tax=Bacteroides cellulosilyticus TaxID=246787 RepID=UPI0032ECAED3